MNHLYPDPLIILVVSYQQISNIREVDGQSENVWTYLKKIFFRPFSDAASVIDTGRAFWVANISENLKKSKWRKESVGGKMIYAKKPEGKSLVTLSLKACLCGSNSWFPLGTEASLSTALTKFSPLPSTALSPYAKKGQICNCNHRWALKRWNHCFFLKRWFFLDNIIFR
jgi:hypothetical protein